GRARTRASPRSPRRIAISPSIARTRPRNNPGAAGSAPGAGGVSSSPGALVTWTISCHGVFGPRPARRVDDAGRKSAQGRRSLRYALDVLVRARIDLDRVADPDEQRYGDRRAGLDGRRLLHVAAGITAHAGLGGRDLEEHERGQRHIDRA